MPDATHGPTTVATTTRLERPSDRRPTTHSLMIAGYEFGIDLDASRVDFEEGRVRDFAIHGDDEVFRQLADDVAFPFDFAGEAPVLYAAGVHDVAGGEAERVTTAEALDDGGTDAAGRAHGAYLQWGEQYAVDLVVLARHNWLFVEGSVAIAGQTYELEARVGLT